ncbi:actin-like ATPase domain-containing protein [Morchella conica CCBAS932]|uniref:Actin-like ATPase domain-containing protein n=1 Tax=Morchella conica CCBAS932 TaxID=1392247 RepID=A0A3N4KRH8_9PEZI|nr:actin-like ATPase domain-containing protein [Morchella conica CCBAS932]
MRPVGVPAAAIPGLLLLLFTTCASASTAILGMDFGQEYIKAALVKPGIPLEIVLTKDTKRKEASAIGFKPSNAPVKEGEFAYPERLYGTDAVNLAARFPHDVYPNLKQLLGQHIMEDEVMTYSSRYPAVNIIPSSFRSTVAFKTSSAPPVDYGEGSFMVEELLAMEFKNIVSNAEALAGPGTKIKNVVFTIPAFFRAEEKHAIELAAKLAGLKVMSFVSDGLAVGINYATTRTFDEKNPEYHIIYDMGAGSTTATVLRFQGKTVKDVGRFTKTVQEVSVLGVGYDRNLGGDIFNQKIFDVLLDDFTSSPKAKKLLEENPKLKEDVKRNGRAAAKLWREATRVRQILSANTETVGSVESLFNEIDFRSNKVLRSTFEELLAEYEDRITKPIVDAISNSGISLDQVNTLILHGGAVRTPFVGKKLEEIMGGHAKISKNVNPDEAAVFGATFKGAAESGGFRVKEIRTHDISAYAVSLKYKKDGESAKETTQQIFPYFAKMGQEKIVPFPKQTDFDFSVLFNLPPRPQDPKQRPGHELLDVVKVQNLTASVQKLSDDFGCEAKDIFTKFSMEISERNGLPKITKGWVECTVETVEEPPKKEGMVEGVKGFFGLGKKKDGEQEVLEEADKTDSKSASSKTASSGKSSASAETSTKEEDLTPKIVKKLQTIPLSYTVEKDGFPEILEKDKEALISKIQGFDKFDKNRHDIEEARNVLEAFTYRGRDYLEDGLFVAASTAEEREKLEALLSQTTDWLYDEGYTADLAAIKQKLADLKALVEPITNRKTEKQKRPEEIKALEDAIEQTEGLIELFNNKPPTPDSELEDAEVPQVPEIDTKALEKAQEETKAWLEKVKADQDVKADYEDPVFTVKELQKKKEALNKHVMDVLQQQKIMERIQKAEAKAAASSSSSASAASASSASASAASASSAAEAEATPNVLEEVVEEKLAEEKEAEAKKGHDEL